jgi:hypothetical protein
MRFGEKFPDVSSGGSTANISFYRVRPEELDYIDSSETSAEEFGFSYRSDRVYSGAHESPAVG